MFRDLIPLLADEFHLIAPDLPSFGKSDTPTATNSTTPSTIWRDVIDRFTEVLGLDALRDLRLRLRRAGRLPARHQAPGRGSPRSSPRTATPTRTASARAGIRSGLLAGPAPANREALRLCSAGDDDLAVHPRRPRRDDGLPGRLRRSTTIIWPGPAPTRSSSTCSSTTPERRAVPGLAAVLPDQQPPLLAVWGSNDPFFLPAGRRGVQARHPGGRHRFVPHRPLRPGDPRRRDRERDHRLPRSLVGHLADPAGVTGSGDSRGIGRPRRLRSVTNRWTRASCGAATTTMTSRSSGGSNDLTVASGHG